MSHGSYLLDATISRVLAAHQGPGRHFCAPVYHLPVDRADAWLRSPALDNLHELELCCYRFFLPSPPQTLQPPPAAALRFSDTLCVATIGDCHLTDSTIQALHFPKLQKLALKRVGISESSFGFGHLRINSINLTGICVKAYSHGRGLNFGELIIENAPFLGSLILSDRLHGLHVDSLTTAVHTIKILAVDMHALSLDVVLDLMRCFPCLEKLYIQSTGPGKTNSWCRKHRDLIRSLDIRLKTIVWRHYRGIKSHVDFATFFILNAGVLELMTFEVNSEDYNEEFFAQHRKMLQVDNRASRGARFRFTSDCTLSLPS
ncbi:uncharacterized protein [Triticum aestivum]|uniref:uncharacterized protein n=1 Tax=Triticum aestivum TaxID=4565 RepID=UPI001D02C5BC|nr:uncharacterized protein LOC123161203 [Triticum aestivum]